MFTFNELPESSFVTVEVLKKDDFKKNEILLNSPISRVDVVSPADGDRDAFVSKFRLFSDVPQLCKKMKDTSTIYSARHVGYMNFTHMSKLLSEQFDCATRENSFRVLSCWYDSTLPSVWRRKGRAISNQCMIPGQSACNACIVILPNKRAVLFRVEPNA